MVMRDGSYVLNTCPRTGKYMDLETHYIKGKHTVLFTGKFTHTRVVVSGMRGYLRDVVYHQ